MPAADGKLARHLRPRPNLQRYQHRGGHGDNRESCPVPVCQSQGECGNISSDEEQTKAQKSEQHKVDKEQPTLGQAATQSKEDRRNDQVADELIELCWMAADAVHGGIACRVRVHDTPGQRSGRPIVHAGQPTADAPDGSSHRDCRRKQVSYSNKRKPVTTRIEVGCQSGSEEASEKRQSTFPDGEKHPRLPEVRQRIILKDKVEPCTEEGPD